MSMHVGCSKSKQANTDKEKSNQESSGKSKDGATKSGVDSGPVAMSAFNALVECATNLRPQGKATDTFSRITPGI
jgi:hypothetical protein